MTGHKDQLAVRLNGGGPWGFRLQGGAGTGLPLVVAKVRRKSKAYKRLHEGDLIVSVNGTLCDNLTYDQVMEIADRSATDLTLVVMRQESNKENLAPTTPEATVKTEQSERAATTKEVVSITDTTTKITEQREGLRIKSATLLDDTSVPVANKLESFTSEKLKERDPATQAIDHPAVDAFPSFAELLQTQGPPKPPRLAATDNTSTMSEEISGDDRNYEKTTKETVHEVKGNTETTIIKEAHESVARGNGEFKVPILNGVPGITMDTIDLNNLISATQKRLDSFKDGYKTDTSTSSLFEVKKTEITSTTSESKISNLSSGVSSSTELKDITFPSEAVDSKKKVSVKKIPPPTLPKPKIRPFSDSFMEHLKDLNTDLNETIGGLGMFTSDTESSCVTTDGPFGSSVLTKKKKMFSSSSFYEEPHAIYPTVEEQVEMARKIADSLADDTNKKSKGSNMFFKRVKRSTKWIHEGPEPSDESAPDTPEIQGEPPTPDPSQVPWKSHQKGIPQLKLVLDPRHTLDACSLRSSGLVFNEHNVVSPEVCHGLVKDLQSPVGKGAALFAKRKKKSAEWVVDEEKVKALMREQDIRTSGIQTAPPLYQQGKGIGRQEMKMAKTPWEAAMESPYGNCDSAFIRVNPDELADNVIKAADYKRTNSISTNLDGSRSPTVPVAYSAAYNDIYHAKAPKGWTTPANVGSFTQPSVPSVPVSYNIPQETPPVHNGFPSTKKMVFQNFNTVPRIWKGTSAH